MDRTLATTYQQAMDTLLAGPLTPAQHAAVEVINQYRLQSSKEMLELLTRLKAMRDALEQAVAVYGKPGGPWNVIHEPGSWIVSAHAALGKGNTP